MRNDIQSIQDIPIHPFRRDLLHRLAPGQSLFPAFLVLGLLLATSTVQAQYYLISEGSFNACSGFFADSGSNTAGYGPNEDFTIAICPDGSTGTHTRLRFAGVDIAPGDELCFFDGGNILAPSLGCAGDYLPGAPFIIQASAANLTGCITVSFTSDGSNEGSGWAADIDCIPACQSFTAAIAGTNPVTVPADTGWIDICPGDDVSVDGAVTFLQNNLLYSQDLSLCQFEWDFGDGSIVNGNNATHRYDKPGGYVISLRVLDQLGCRNTNFIERRVRVAPRPQFTVGTLPGPLCFADTLSLAADSDPAATPNIQVSPQTERFELMKTRSDSLALPDGNGASYQTSVLFSDFAPNQLLTDPAQILAICATMEHSWMRDLNITITCPSGQSTTLVNQEETGDEVFLGDPFEGDELLPEPIPGTGFSYCWYEGAPNGTWLEYANANDPGTLPAGSYAPFESLSNLVGCPLNGEWVLTIQDLWEIDNGFIFSWNIQFDESLLGNLETFTPAITDLQWLAQPNILLDKGKEILATANTAGEVAFGLEVTDAFQCVTDTFLRLPVLPPTHPDCYACDQMAEISPDTAVCEGHSVTLDATAMLTPGTQIPWACIPRMEIGFGNAPPASPMRLPLTVEHLFPLNLSPGAAEIVSVCLNFRTDPVGNIELLLEAPDGTQLPLSMNNGGTGQNFTQTCFSHKPQIPSALRPHPIQGHSSRMATGVRWTVYR